MRKLILVLSLISAASFYACDDSPGSAPPEETQAPAEIVLVSAFDGRMFKKDYDYLEVGKWYQIFIVWDTAFEVERIKYQYYYHDKIITNKTRILPDYLKKEGRLGFDFLEGEIPGDNHYVEAWVYGKDSVYLRRLIQVFE